MFIVRPIEKKDLDWLEAFAYATTLGMISLPRDRKLLEEKINLSCHSFLENITKPGHEFYLFVLENTKNGAIGGTSGIYAKTGIKHPLYYYRIETIIPKKNGLPLPDEIKILHPMKETNGPSELCALFLSKEFRHLHLGELLSRSRYLFIAEHPYRFTENINARLRGFINKSKLTSPFWEACGQHFFKAPFKEAEDRHQKGTAFIGKFLPKYPIYTTLLPKQAQYVIQKTHVTTKPALNMLLKEGFSYLDQVDIFEAGPVVSSKTSEIKSIKNNILGVVKEIVDHPLNGKPEHIISNTSLNFKACYGTVKMLEGGGVALTKEVAYALSLKVSDKIRFISTGW